MAKRIQQKPRKQRSLRGMARRGLSILMAMVMVISLIQISAFADVNDTEFHIMTLADMKNVVSAENGDDVSDIEICTLKVHGQNASADGGAITKYGVFGDVGYPGINGKDTYNGTDYWKVLNTFDIVDVSEGITGLTIYYRAAGEEKECYVPGSELQVEQLTGMSGLITEIYFKDSGETPEEESYPVYVYVEPKDGQGTINGHNYMTIGEISLPVIDPAQANINNNYYEEYAQAISTALNSIQRFEANEWLDLEDVDWTGLYVRYGADDYVSDSSQLVWHLDGKIKDKTALYSVIYNANGGQGDVPVDTNLYAAGQPFAVMSGAGLSKEDCAFLGWSVNPDATQPDESFAIPKEGGHVTLYAVWKDQTDPDPDPQGEVTNFYISLNGTVWDYVDADGNKVVTGRDTSNFSGSVGTGKMTETDLSYTLVGKANEAASTDAAIRALANLKDVPTDADVFAALQKDEKMQAYCTANKMDITTITSEKYDIYWYVVKYENDGWHVDGVLVEKGEQPGYPVDYTVTHEYYTNGTKTGEESQTLSGHVGDKVNAADLKKQLTDAQGNTYSYTSASAESIILTDNPAANKITLRYDRTTGGGNPGGGNTYYTMTVKYLEADTEDKLADDFTTSILEGTSYDMTAQTEKVIDGYEISDVTGDKVTGFMNGDREIIVYYTVYIDDGETPLNPGPGGDGSGDGDTDIGDIEVPLDPGTGNNGDGTDIGDENVPLVPATGDNLALWVLAAVVSAAGLVYLTVTGKKREQENG